LSTAECGPRMMSSQQMAHASMCSSDGSTPAARAALSASSFPFSSLLNMPLYASSEHTIGDCG